MSGFDRDEIEKAFAAYLRVADTAATTGDWNPWADQFTEDAHYVEHHYGEFHGREAIRAWINETMARPPGSQMPAFPVEWHLVDADAGRVVAWIWNRMQDPGDGSVHQEGNITILQYAGDGLWSYEEDVYNPARFSDMLDRWKAARDAAGGGWE
jgi:hypothetical protein